jgi:hypothetical protein
MSLFPVQGAITSAIAPDATAIAKPATPDAPKPKKGTPRKNYSELLSELNATRKALDESQKANRRLASRVGALESRADVQESWNAGAERAVTKLTEAAHAAATPCPGCHGANAVHSVRCFTSA